MESEKAQKFVKIELEGKDNNLWKNLQSKLIGVINNFLDSVIDHKNESTIREEAKKFTSALLDYGKNKLEKAGLDNEKIVAEVDLLYSQKEKQFAEARKLHAEADLIELQTNVKKLKIALSSMKLLMIGEANNEEIIFLKQIDVFLQTIKEIEGNKPDLY